MRYTKAGFPLVKTPHKYLSHLFDNKGYGNNFIDAHCNSENNTAHLHELMWLLTNDNYITHTQVDDLFKVRLTMKGVEFVETVREMRRKDIYTIISIIVSLLAIIISVFALFRHF